ncbi:MAG: hypothetical protein ACPGTP_09775 [Bacteroidia bacterium]
MNKIIFVGIILITGLFSLQFSLMGYHSTNKTAQEQSENNIHSIQNPTLENNVQVIYICPDDSTTINNVNRAVDILL